MQSAIFSIFALATLATALPTGGSSSQCSPNQYVSCCNPFTAGIGIQLGIGCVNVISVDQCSATQQAACCSSGDTDQNGVVNVNVQNLCTPIAVA